MWQVLLPLVGPWATRLLFTALVTMAAVWKMWPLLLPIGLLWLLMSVRVRRDKP